LSGPVRLERFPEILGSAQKRHLTC
jgi:hypothetical protein